MSEHTPTTASIRSDYIRGTAADFIATEGKRCPCGEAHGVKSETAQVTLVWDAETRAVAGPEFDRWLAAELAAAWAEGHDAGWDERNEFVNYGAIPSGIHQSEAVNPYLTDRIEEDQ